MIQNTPRFQPVRYAVAARRPPSHSVSSLSQLLEALGSTPNIHSVLGVVDEFDGPRW
jgi:hypothetical protein